MKTHAPLAIKLNKVAEKAVKQGHPWVFEQSISKLPDLSAPAGTLCVLFDQRSNRPFAFGLWDPKEIIRIKIIYRGSKLRLDTLFWQDQAAQAYAQRLELIDKGVSGYRAIHGENDFMPGLILDVYAQTGVLKLYSEIWQPYLEELLDIFRAQFGLERIIIRYSRKLSLTNPYSYEEGQVVGKALAHEKITFTEYGVSFYAYVLSGHKTGFFLDQRPNRHWVQRHAVGKTVLDVFSYVGGFGIHALKGGARSLTSVDISQQAMEVAREHVELNQLDPQKWHPMAMDAFDALNQLIQDEEYFDLVIIDPPSFAKQANEVGTASRQYQRLAQLGKQLVAPGGVLILGSCSSRISLEAFEQIHQRAGLNAPAGWKKIKTVLHDVDHPIGFAESNYLKTMFYRRGF